MVVGDKVFFTDVTDEDYEELRMVKLRITGVAAEFIQVEGEGYDFICLENQVSPRE